MNRPHFQLIFRVMFPQKYGRIRRGLCSWRGAISVVERMKKSDMCYGSKLLDFFSLFGNNLLLQAINQSDRPNHLTPAVHAHTG